MGEQFVEFQQYRSIWISDIHLGTPGASALQLLHFLKHSRSEYLFLVGDIVDGWKLKKSWYWPQAHNDVVQKLLRKARHGTNVIFIPGNHDEAARQYANLTFGEIKICHDYIHETADEKKLWVVHGDLFDQVIQHARWLAYNRWLNVCRDALNLPYWSLSQYLKLKVKAAVSLISAFEHVMVTEARRRGCDGIICGHIHKPELKTVDGIIYGNDGDWVESLSALVEHHDGTLELLDWDQICKNTDWRAGFSDVLEIVNEEPATALSTLVSGSQTQ